MVVQAEHEVHAAEHQHGGADHAPDKLGDEILHLGDVVGHAGHQGTRAQPVHLGEGEGHDSPEAVLAHLVADVLPGVVHEHVVHRPAEAPEQHQPHHLQPKPPDQRQVARAAVVQPQHAVVHNPAHDARQNQSHQHLAHHAGRRQRRKVQIPPHIVPDAGLRRFTPVHGAHPPRRRGWHPPPGNAPPRRCSAAPATEAASASPPG